MWGVVGQESNGHMLSFFVFLKKRAKNKSSAQVVFFK
jgi:hypothetical protein